MSPTNYGQYFEAEILSADPVKLISLLYRGALDAVAAARLHVRNGEIRERSRQITKAYDITHELLQSLNFEAGGEISRNLAGLYVYMEERLLAANSQQSEAPLAEVENLLATLAEAWKSVPPMHELSAANEHAAQEHADHHDDYAAQLSSLQGGSQGGSQYEFQNGLQHAELHSEHDEGYSEDHEYSEHEALASLANPGYRPLNLSY